MTIDEVFEELGEASALTEEYCICMGNVIYHYKRRRNAKKKDNEL